MTSAGWLAGAMMLAALALPSMARAQGAPLDDPRGGQRIYVATPGAVTLRARDGDEERCEAPCLLHLRRGNYHLQHLATNLSGDLTVGRFPLVIEAHPRSDLELGIGIAAVALALGTAAIAVGVDASGEGGCVRGGPCDTGLVAALIPAGVSLILGLVLIFDAGGELSVQEVRRLPGRDHHDE